MKRAALILALLIPGLASGQALVRKLTLTKMDARYLKLTGGTLSGDLTLDADLITSTGIITSTVADGTVGFLLNVENAHATGNLFEIREAGGAAFFSVLPNGTIATSGNISIGGKIFASKDISNSSGSSDCTDSNGSLCVLDDLQIDGILYIEETTTPSAVANYGALWWQSDNKLYGQDGDGDTHVIHGFQSMQAWSFSNNNISGTHYIAGGYPYSSATEIVLTQGGATATLGSAGNDEPHGAHVYVVCKGDGANTSGNLVLTVIGSSITDAGVYVGSDSEDVLADALLATCATDAYFETVKKWVGEITFTLSSSGGSSFNWSGNVGFSAYADSFNNDFTISGFECRGQAGASTTLDIELLHHPADGSGWTYSASSFVAGNSAIARMSTEYEGGEIDLTSGKEFNFKRTGLSAVVSGSTSGGYLIRVTTGANNAVNHMTCNVGVEF